nr:tyrosine-type recombinase/integrase [Methylibium rhizosphaerae]
MVPKDLQAQNAGEGGKPRTKLVVALGTADLREARLRAAQKRAEYETLFTVQRARLKPRSIQPTREVVTHLAALFRHELLSDDDRTRANPHTTGATAALGAALLLGAEPVHTKTTPTGHIVQVHALGAELLPDDDADPLAGFKREHAQLIKADHQRTLAGWKEDAADGRLEVARRAADRMAQRMGLQLDWGTAGARELLVTFQRSMIDAAAALVARGAGESVETPEAPAAQQVAAPARLRDALAPWRAAKPNRHAKTVRDTELALEAFEAFTGNPPLSRLTLAHGDDFRAWLLKQSSSEKTAANKFAAVNGLLNYAADQRGMIERNPWAKLRVNITKRTKGGPWALGEVATIFGTSLFTCYELPPQEKAAQDAAYWVPLLALFTGARVSELAQLRIRDLVLADSSAGPATLAVLSITDEPEDDEVGTFATATKTAGSVRTVPLHRELIRLGFLEYAAAIKEAGAAQMFPSVQRREGKGAGDDLSTWFGKYRRGLGITRPRAGIHAARHTMRTALANAGATDAQAFAIGGWSGARGPGNSTYLHALSPEVLREVLDRVTYAGLTLPRVFKEPAWAPKTNRVG